MLSDRTETPWLDQDPLDIVGEQWRAIKGYEGYYEVSNYGRVKSAPRPKRLKVKILGLRLSPSGVIVALFRDGGPQFTSLRKTVAEAFDLVCPAGQEWYPKNGNGLDTRLSNLVSRYPPPMSAPAPPPPIQLSPQSRRDKEVGIYENEVMVAQICRDCRVPEPLSAFSLLKNVTPPRHSRVCRSCANLVHVLGRRGARKVLDEQEGVAAGHRCCAHCHQERPLDTAHFRRNSTTSGFNYVCLVCRPVTQKAVVAESAASKRMGTLLNNIIVAGLAGDPRQVEAYARLLADNLDAAGQHKQATRVRRVLGEQTVQSQPVGLDG